MFKCFRCKRKFEHVVTVKIFDPETEEYLNENLCLKCFKKDIKTRMKEKNNE